MGISWRKNAPRASGGHHVFAISMDIIPIVLYRHVELEKGIEMGHDRVVICMKWGTLFPPDYVNVLFNACRKQIQGDFRFICLTDDSEGLISGVEALPIPDIGLAENLWYTPGVWPKLALYCADLHGLRGRALFIDLDMMITGPLDEMFEVPGGYVALAAGRGWSPNGAGKPIKTATGVFAFDIGGQCQVLRRFQDDMAHVVSTYQNEQEFVGETVRDLHYWPDGWVISFKRFLRRAVGVDLFLPPCEPPDTARIVAFHGTPRPIDLLPRNAGFWDRFPHLGHGQVKWLAQYWEQNGGRLPPNA